MDDGIPFMVTELLEGMTLEAWLKAEPRADAAPDAARPRGADARGPGARARLPGDSTAR